MATGSNKKTHRLVERLDADHRERVVFVLGEEEKKPTQKQLKQRREIIVQLRQLGFFGPPKLPFKRAFDKYPQSGSRRRP